MAKELAVRFHQIADHLDNQKFWRYAEQLRAAGLSVSNNIAEGSASPHPQEFKQYLNIARRSLFENASMLYVFEEMSLLKPDEATLLLRQSDELSRKITNLARTL